MTAAHQRSVAGWAVGSTVYATLPGLGVVQGTLSAIREADDGSLDISVPHGHAGVYLAGRGRYYVPWDNLRGSL